MTPEEHLLAKICYVMGWYTHCLTVKHMTEEGERDMYQVNVCYDKAMNFLVIRAVSETPIAAMDAIVNRLKQIMETGK